MDPEISKRFEALELKLDSVHQSIERMRKYFLWALIITIAVIVLPLIGLAFALPAFLSSFGSIGGL